MVRIKWLDACSKRWFEGSIANYSCNMRIHDLGTELDPRSRPKLRDVEVLRKSQTECISVSLLYSEIACKVKMLKDIVLKTHFHATHTPELLSPIILPLQHPCPNNPHFLYRPIFRPRSHKPHPFHNPHPPRNAPKNGMFAIQPRRRR